MMRFVVSSFGFCGDLRNDQRSLAHPKKPQSSPKRHHIPAPKDIQANRPPIQQHDIMV
jgi:hypothetical protein